MPWLMNLSVEAPGAREEQESVDVILLRRGSAMSATGGSLYKGLCRV